MQKGNWSKKIKLLVTVAIILAFVWFLIVSPMITFHNNENKLLEAAKRYFELNSSELPTGERVKTLSLKTLYHKAFLKEDLFVPYTNKTCSIENSWVKVKRVDGEYKYYTYLECGVLSSTVDHKGPVITLNGDKEMTIGKGEKYTELGVKSLVDNTDGKLDIKNVTISGEVDTSTVDTYEITYTAYDSLKNKTEVVREVKVVQKLNSTIKSSLNDKKIFTGELENNYIKLSNMLFRVYGLDDKNNVIIVSDEDIANVNYTKIDKWLDYYYNNLNDFTKKAIVENKYCNMTIKDKISDVTKCSSYTNNKKIYIPSAVEVNTAEAKGNYMKPSTYSWIANSKDKNTAYIINGTDNYLAYNSNYNYGIRPMMTIKGDILITGGDGSKTDPYVFGDTKKGKGGSLVSERTTGEYISIDGSIYRIIKTNSDGTTKVISNYTVNSENGNVVVGANAGQAKIVYNPKDKNSSAYFINNRVSEYVNTKYFVKHEISVPIYKKDIIYGEEVKTNKYSVMLSAPNMYEMFSAQPQNGIADSYWMINTSQADRTAAAVYDRGVAINGRISDYERLNVRFVAFIKKGTTISSGEGTEEKPYIIK